MGRFMRPDNIMGNLANPQSWNLYSYVGGNPMKFSDPTGHVPTWPDDPEKLKQARAKFDAQKAIPGIGDTGDVPAGMKLMPGTAGTHIGVYRDANMPDALKESAKQGFFGDLVASAVAEFGPIGILLEFEYLGEITVHATYDAHGSKVLYLNPVPPAGVLSVILTGERWSTEQKALFITAGKGLNVILLPPGSGAITFCHELLHAFGIRPNWIIDDWTPFMNLEVLELKVMKSRFWAADILRQGAASYVPAF